MHHEVLREKLKAQPFVPFRLVMTSGRTYDIQSPEWMMVWRLTTAVGIPGQYGDGEIVSLLDNLHINELVPLQTVSN